MSVKSLNKVIICSSALTGEVFFQMPYDDFMSNQAAVDYLVYKCSEYIENEQGIITKIGYKN